MSNPLSTAAAAAETVAAAAAEAALAVPAAALREEQTRPEFAQTLTQEVYKHRS